MEILRKSGLEMGTEGLPMCDLPSVKLNIENTYTALVYLRFERNSETINEFLWRRRRRSLAEKLCNSLRE
jgi:hypothetical protein